MKLKAVKTTINNLSYPQTALGSHLGERVLLARREAIRQSRHAIQRPSMVVISQHREDQIGGLHPPVPHALRSTRFALQLRPIHQAPSMHTLSASYTRIDRPRRSLGKPHHRQLSRTFDTVSRNSESIPCFPCIISTENKAQHSQQSFCTDNTPRKPRSKTKHPSYGDKKYLKLKATQTTERQISQMKATPRKRNRDPNRPQQLSLGQQNRLKI